MPTDSHTNPRASIIGSTQSSGSNVSYNLTSYVIPRNGANSSDAHDISTMEEQAYLTSLKNKPITHKRSYETMDRESHGHLLSQRDNNAHRINPIAPISSTTSSKHTTFNNSLPIATPVNVSDSVGRVMSIPSNNILSLSSNNGKGSKRRPLPTASAAAAVAHNISFNNDGFSDSDDNDNELMGMLGEQSPIEALQRLTQMKQN